VIVAASCCSWATSVVAAEEAEQTGMEGRSSWRQRAARLEEVEGTPEVEVAAAAGATSTHHFHFHKGQAEEEHSLGRGTKEEDGDAGAALAFAAMAWIRVLGAHHKEPAGGKAKGQKAQQALAREAAAEAAA
jgi:hypothetical protein